MTRTPAVYTAFIYTSRRRRLAIISFARFRRKGKQHATRNVFWTEFRINNLRQNKFVNMTVEKRRGPLKGKSFFPRKRFININYDPASDTKSPE